MTPQNKYNKTEKGKATNKRALLAFRERRNALLYDIKSVPCARCGGTFPPYCMDFHHRNPEDKKFTIAGKMSTIGLEKLLDEIAKCDILCANCHREVEHFKRGGV